MVLVRVSRVIKTKDFVFFIFLMGSPEIWRKNIFWQTAILGGALAPWAHGALALAHRAL